MAPHTACRENDAHYLLDNHEKAWPGARFPFFLNIQQCSWHNSMEALLDFCIDSFTKPDIACTSVML